MLREMSSEQLYEWMAFYQLEPFGTVILDYEFAHFKALYANSNLKKGKRPYKTEKFLLFGEKKNAVDAEWDEDDAMSGS